MKKAEHLSRGEARPISTGQLRRGMEQEEFELHYQPKVDLHSGEIVGAEALIRWRHSEYGLLSPADFLGVAETSEVAVELGRWVRRQVAGLAARVNRGRRVPLRLSSNASVIELADAGFFASVADALGDCDPNWLIVEVTETASVSGLSPVLECLHDLRRLGVGIALDDFGTGYSSLCRLLDWPFSEIKIDRAFIWGLQASETRQAIVRHAVALGRDLGLEVVAEGVETTEEWAVLSDMHCPIGQGFLFGRPMEQQAFQALMARGDSIAFDPHNPWLFKEC